MNTQDSLFQSVTERFGDIVPGENACTKCTGGVLFTWLIKLNIS